jgi:hypothetical protein
MVERGARFRFINQRYRLGVELARGFSGAHGADFALSVDNSRLYKRLAVGPASQLMCVEMHDLASVSMAVR